MNTESVIEEHLQRNNPSPSTVSQERERERERERESSRQAISKFRVA
jgi:hypothetical protein